MLEPYVGMPTSSHIPVVCPDCKREWEANSEQAVCVEIYNECVVCRFTPSAEGSGSGTTADYHHIIDIQKDRVEFNKYMAEIDK